MAGKAHRSGGARPGAGRPRSSKPRCACDKHTLDHAWKNRLKCGGAARCKMIRAFGFTGTLPMAQREILATIETQPLLIERLTAKELAAVIAALDAHWHKARVYEATEILAEGHLWDTTAKAFRLLTAPVTQDEFVHHS